MPSFNHLRSTDRKVYDLVKSQLAQEATSLKLIASENFASSAVLEALASVFSNKYAEGYAGARYYEGNVFSDELELLAIERLKALFGAEHANVQPYSGSPANHAVYRALLKHGDKVMGLSLPSGGHLTHGWNVSFSGMDYQFIGCPVNSQSGLIDYDEMRTVARRERPKLIWVGATAYPRVFDYEIIADIASEVKAYVAADIAHICGLIVGGVHPNPTPHVDVVSSTSHKSLRGPRGGFLLSRKIDRYQDLYHSDSKFDLARRLDRAVFPQLQGGPHLNAIAAIAVALQEAATEEFRSYAQQTVRNCQALAQQLLGFGYSLVTGGTDNHLLVMDLRDRKYSGKDYARFLADAGLILNFNTVPNDPRKPAVTSGLRIGTPAITSMGVTEAHIPTIARFIHGIVDSPDDQDLRIRTRREVAEFCSHFRIPGVSDCSME